MEKLFQSTPIAWLLNYGRQRSELETTNTTLIPRGLPVDIRMDSLRQQRQNQRFGLSGHGSVSNNNAAMDTELHMAARHGNIGMARGAVGRRREMLWCQDPHGNLPLHLAVQNAHGEVASYLAEEYPQGCYALNRESITPIHLAVERQQMDLVGCMFQRISGHHVGVIEATLTRHRSIVNTAISHGNQEMLRVMFNNRPRLLETHDGEGWTPLSYSAYHDSPLVDFFLENYPGSVTQRNRDNTYPIHQACQGGHIQVLKKFYAHSPDSLTQSDGHGRTILHVAAKEPNNRLRHVVSYLLNLNRQDISRTLIVKKDENLVSPLDLAKSVGNDEIQRIIKQRIP